MGNRTGQQFSQNRLALTQLSGSRLQLLEHVQHTREDVLIEVPSQGLQSTIQQLLSRNCSVRGQFHKGRSPTLGLRILFVPVVRGVDAESPGRHLEQAPDVLLQQIRAGLQAGHQRILVVVEVVAQEANVVVAGRLLTHPLRQQALQQLPGEKSLTFQALLQPASGPFGPPVVEHLKNGLGQLFLHFEEPPDDNPFSLFQGTGSQHRQRRGLVGPSTGGLGIARECSFLAGVKVPIPSVDLLSILLALLVVQPGQHGGHALQLAPHDGLAYFVKRYRHTSEPLEYVCTVRATPDAWRTRGSCSDHPPPTVARDGGLASPTPYTHHP